MPLNKKGKKIKAAEEQAKKAAAVAKTLKKGK